MQAHQRDAHGSSEGGRFRIPGRLALVGFIAIAGYFLLTEHRAHAIQFLPFLLLLACPLLHMFREHGGHRRGDEHRDGDASKRDRTEGDRQ